MPRKVNYGIDYDEDYDTYDDFDEYDDQDYDHAVEENGYDHGVEGHVHGRERNGMSSLRDKTVNMSGLWRCSICTYDNDGSSLCCDMCGVFQDSSVNLDKDASTGISPTTIKEKATAATTTIKEKAIVKFPPNDEIPSSSSCSLSKPNYVNEIESCNSIRENSDMPQVLASELDNVKLDSNSTNIRNDNSCSVYKPEKWMLSDQEQGIFNQLNLAIVGHVDSGKSTLSGRLLHLLGRISKKEMHKYEKEAKQMGKGSFAYAWAMDESVEERERGVTMTVAVAYFDSKNYRVVLLDSPGHKDFVSHMISGATQADAAVLVVDASKGSFEAGMDGYGIGQTREHAQLIRSFCVEQLIVAVNKMDAVDFSKEMFDFIKFQLGSFLRSCGFKESSVTWIPLSAMENQNLVTEASDDHLLSWRDNGKE